MWSRKKPKANPAGNDFTLTDPRSVGGPVPSAGQPPPSPNGYIGALSVGDPTPTEIGSPSPTSTPVDEPSPNGPSGTPPLDDQVMPGGEEPGAWPDASAGPSPEPSANGWIGTGQSAGRDAGGRFTRGNRGGTGNPHAKQVARLRSALLHGVTEEDFQNVTRKLLEMALSGDLDATKLLFQYTIGKPANGVDPDDVENGVDLFRRIDAMPSIPEAVRASSYTVSGRVFTELVERLLGGQNAEHVLKVGLTDPQFQAQMEAAQRRRTAV